MTNRTYEPLTADNAAVILVDHQVGLMTGVRDISTGELKHNVVALAKAAKALGLPIVVATTARDSMWGPTIPELVEALPGVQIIDRSSVNAYRRQARRRRDRGHRPQEPDLRRHLARSLRRLPGDDRRCARLQRLCRRRCFAAPSAPPSAKSALLSHEPGRRVLSDYATLMVEILGDNARPEAGAVYAALDMPWAMLVGQIAGAFAK